MKVPRALCTTTFIKNIFCVLLGHHTEGSLQEHKDSNSASQAVQPQSQVDGSDAISAQSKHKLLLILVGTQCTSLMAEKQLCKKGLGGPGGQEDKPAMCPCGTEGQQPPRLHQQNCRSRKQIISLYFSTFDVLIRLPYPVWGSQQKEFIDKLE